MLQRGGYGGTGGTGGYFIPGAGGGTYGTPGFDDIEMGSSGGNGEFPLLGGNGGGMVTINARRITLSGTILASGGHAGSPGNTGSGGGSGGGVMLRGYDLEVTGTIHAKGGDGAVTNSGNAGGGGGGGGRIKRVYGFTSTGAPTLNVSGGAGNSGGQPGLSGSLRHELIEWYEVTSTVGSEQVLAVEPGTLSQVRVGQPLPNPARGGVALSIDLDRESRCRLEIVDLQGRRVMALDRTMAPGAHELGWNLQDGAGRRVPVGVYLANVWVGDESWSRRIVVVQ